MILYQQESESNYDICLLCAPVQLALDWNRIKLHFTWLELYRNNILQWNYQVFRLAALQGADET